MSQVPNGPLSSDCEFPSHPDSTARGFDSESFMNTFKEEFLQFVDSHAIATRLEIENVISERTAHIMENSSKSDGNEKLFLHLQKQANPNSICKLCKVMTSKNGYQNMKRLGQKMKNYLDLLTSMYNMHMYTMSYGVHISMGLVWLTCSLCGVPCLSELPCTHFISCEDIYASVHAFLKGCMKHSMQ